MKKPFVYHLCLLAFLILAALGIYLSGRRVRLPYADQMQEAAALHRRALQAVKEERLRRGCAMVPEDTLQIGLLGEQISPITTSLGSLEAKRTAQLPDFAALCVRLFHEAGLQKGDRVGACFSGSFPGLNLAVLCAAEVMDLEIHYSCSIGSSNYGANLPAYVLPEMIQTAVQAGCLSTMPELVSLGGSGDAGQNMQGYVMEEPEEIDAMLLRLAEEGIRLSAYPDYEENIRVHQSLLGPVKAFVNVGGNILGLGNEDVSLGYGQGLLKPASPRITETSGLVERYLAAGVPTIHLLNIKQLCAETGIPFDPLSLPEEGSSGVYYSRDYSRPLIALVFAGTAAALIWISLAEAREKGRRE
ncbi:MAG: poly-gamma-glutamate system protein [Lachnospiraceae bacterium]|nr:poly-gamma-glutamate system protein [Lachnospiraceae bacterium]